MVTYIDGGMFSRIAKKHIKEAIETPEPEEDLPNRYKFHDGEKVVFTEEAIKEKIYEDFMTKEELSKLLYMYVRRTNNYPEGRGHTGQWIETSRTHGEWIDSYWFEKFKEPDGVGPLSDIRNVQEAYMRLTEEHNRRIRGIW